MAETDASITAGEALLRLEALPSGAAVLLLGATDTGKTTWMREAVTACGRAGRPVAVIDTDLGQSEVGPPATVGAAFAEPEAGANRRALRDLAPLDLFFVGATSPVRHVLDVCIGTWRMVQAVAPRRPSLTLVDTCGLVQGLPARQLARGIAGLLQPQAIVAFARGRELDSLLALFAGLKAPEIWRVTVGPEVGRKTAAARATRRAARLAAALERGREVVLNWDDIALVGTGLGGGSPLAHHLQQWIGRSLRAPVLHAEQFEGGPLYVVINGERWAGEGLAAVESHFHVARVVVAPAQKFAHLLVGPVDAAGALLGLGVIERIDFIRRTLTLFTPAPPAAIRQIWLGALRVRPDGKELGETRPGDV